MSISHGVVILASEPDAMLKDNLHTTLTLLIKKDDNGGEGSKEFQF